MKQFLTATKDFLIEAGKFIIMVSVLAIFLVAAFALIILANDMDKGLIK